MAASVTVAAQVPPTMVEEIHAWMEKEFGPVGPSRSEAIRRLLRQGLDACQWASTRQEPLLLPPPFPSEDSAALTLTEVATLIRKAAETNPFVRPLADYLEGRV
ncbi:hypothetical protein [Aquabacter cavernae]|uniref:hypothetical protein n=1 Tax=Aquabacter cavernae TaxID=2496029 RepID=UPI000F8CB157|nr:hypothetical protein [Aquabacter cavernae]